MISDAIRYAGMAAPEQDRFANKPGFYNIENIILSKPDYLIVDGSDEIDSLKFEHDRYHPALKATLSTETSNKNKQNYGHVRTS